MSVPHGTKLDEIIWCCCHYFTMSIFIYFSIMIMIFGTTYMVMETRRWNQIPSAGVTDSYKLLCECWELNQVPLEEHPVLWTILLSLQQYPHCVSVIVTTCTICGTPICKCLQRYFTNQAESLINFITTFSLPKMVLSSLLTCIIQ